MNLSIFHYPTFNFKLSTLNCGIAALCVLLLSGCKSHDFIYLTDMPVDMPLPITNKQQTHIKPGDRLNIHVSCNKQELAVPFNNVSYKVTEEGRTSSSDVYAPNGYLVDEHGYIDFPILGRLQVGGLTLPQTNEYIKGLLIEGQHVPDAVIETQITNFTIYGLGALSPRKLVVPDAKINILQAVTQMGDLQSRAKYKKVRVIREDDGQRMEFDIDMTSTDLFDSPAFYLQQNDIVYAEPKKQKTDAASKATIWISILATLASIAYSVTYMVK